MRRAAVALGLAGLLSACAADPTRTPAQACPDGPPTSVSAQATLEDATLATVRVGGAVEGEFEMELYGERAPIATANFVSLARCGFYDGVTFHRVIAGFVIQAGDPQTRDNRGDFQGLGSGGPGYGFEIEPPAEGLRYDPYTVAMANDTVENGSQFFVVLGDLDAALRARGVYTIFGSVVNGTDVVDAIAQVPVADPESPPLTPVIVESIRISAGGPPQASPGA